MSTNEIPLVSGPQTLKVKLNGTIYTLTIVYRGMWVMDIADQSGNPLVCGLALVTGADLLAQFAYLGLGGAMRVASDGADQGAVPTYTNLGQKSHLYWITP